MNAPTGMARVAAALAFAVTGPCMAEVGIMDGADRMTGYQSGKTRLEVQQEYLDARSQGLLPRGDADRWTPAASDRDIGARGPAGSRYQGRSRQDVIDELREYRSTHNPNKPRSPGDLYFGG